MSTRHLRRWILAPLTLAALGLLAPELAASRPRASQGKKDKDPRRKSNNGQRSAAQAQGHGRGQGHAYGQRGATPRGRGQAVAPRGANPRGQGHASPAGRGSHGHQGQAVRHGHSHRSRGTAVVRSGHTHRRVLTGYRHGYRPYRSYYVASAAPVVVVPPPRAETRVYRDPMDDRLDLGVGLGVVAASPDGLYGLPMLNGKLRLLGQVTPRLGLGFDLDASSLLLANTVTASGVVSYDLLAGSGVALRPYASLGAGALHLYDGDAHHLGPALSVRGGLEFKPVRWMGLGLEAGSVVAPNRGDAHVLPFVGGSLALYLL